MNRIELRPYSKIYVICPAYYKTGGTELLHQYVYVLNKNNYNCTIVYPDATKEKNINEAFRKYVKSYMNLSEIIDDENNIIIVPEIFTNLLRNYKKLVKVIWWESVNNYLICQSIHYNLKKFFDRPKESIFTILRIILKKKIRQLNSLELKSVNYHFVQSIYARDFLQKNGIIDNVFYVSDYLNDIYLDNAKVKQINVKENYVCYNPKKGKRFTKLIINKAKNIKFIPLINMSNDQVVDTLKHAKVYIDFGEHPGKDRIPREAACMHCCVITNKMGSANFFEDVMINDEFKFTQKRRNIKNIVFKIDECLKKYESIDYLFDNYRKYILSEKDAFEKDVLSTYSFKE